MVPLMFAAEGGGERSIVWEGSVGRLLEFLDVALGAVVVRVGAVDANEIVM